MKKKLMILGVAALSCACVGFAACGDKSGEHTHEWSQTWVNTATHHWHLCTAPDCTIADASQMSGYGEHDFTNGDCICGYPFSEHTHKWSQSYEKDDTHHWHNCTVPGCDEKEGNTEHDFTNGNCVCGAERTLKYTLNSDSESYSVTGIGSIADSEIIIPKEHRGKPVTGIGEGAFRLLDNITSVSIPDSVTSIGDTAFYRCINLTSVNIPEKVTVIGYHTFGECLSLESIEIPDGVTSIGSGAFAKCDSLASINIPDSVTSIGASAFGDCDKLTEIKHSEDIASWCQISGLRNVALSSVYLGNLKLQEITSVTIPFGVTVINDYAFYNCGALTGITIPESVTQIGSYSLFGCGFESVALPANLTGIGEYAFTACKNLTSIEIPCGVESIGDYAFNNCPRLSSVTIKDGVRSIGEEAFNSCAFSEITIPDSVTQIGVRAFAWCNSLKAINFTGTTEQWNAIEKGYQWDYRTKDYTVKCSNGEIVK